jgi:fructokinase
MRIGIDLGGTKIEAIALEGSRERVRRRVPTPRGDYEATVSAVASLVRQIGDGTVGIGIPGALSRVSGLVKNANSTWLIGRPLKRDLEQAIGRECGWRTTRTASRYRKRSTARGPAPKSCSA